MVLAAGEGRRLQPLTSEQPKPLVPLCNRPMIHHALDRLRAAGVREAIVNTFHLGERVVGALGAGPVDGPALRYSQEPELLGTGGGLRRAAWFFEGEDAFLVFNGDVFCQADLGAALAAHRSSGAVATLVVTRRADLPPELHKVAWDPTTGRIVEVDRVPAVGGPGLARGIYTGVLVGSPLLLAALPEQGPACLKEQGFWPLLRAGAHLHAYETTATWSDVGTPSTYLRAHFNLLDAGPRDLLPPDYREVDEGVFVHPLARVHADAELVGPVVIGPETRVDKGAVVGPRVVLGRNCYVTPTGRIRALVAWDGVIVHGEARRQIWWRNGIVDG
jgi:NDP-sugar pyrophosphorylase family protein